MSASSTSHPTTESPADWAADLDRRIDELFPRMVSVRRHLHQQPEPSGEEVETTRYLAGLLEAEQFDVHVASDGRGLVAEPDGQPPSEPRLGIRADIDALRIHDVKQVPYHSLKPGIMHACGHDAHSATVLGAALALREAAADSTLPWPVVWRAIFQPAEEISEGAKKMIADGAIHGVEAVVAAHMDPSRPVGRIGLREGMLTANCDAFRITVHGRGGHAARPHETIDPITAACQLVGTLYMFVPRSTNSQDAVVVSIGQISGGHNANVIPEEVTLRGTLRTLNLSVRDRTIEHIRHLARGLAETSRTEMDIEFSGACEGVQNDRQITGLLRDAAGNLLGKSQLDEIPRASMGSEDFSAYLEHLPGSMFRLGCAGETTGTSPLHTPTFDIDERAMAIGAKIFARAVVTWCDPSRRR